MLLQFVKKIEVAVSCSTDREILKVAQKHLSTALTLINATGIGNEAYKTNKRVAPNSNSENQLRFHSTKKKRTCRKRLAKPTDMELTTCQDELDKVEISVCAYCLLDSDDEQGTSIDWIKCDTCDKWFHQSCAGVLSATDSYECKFCS